MINSLRESTQKVLKRKLLFSWENSNVFRNWRSNFRGVFSSFRDVVCYRQKCKSPSFLEPSKNLDAFATNLCVQNIENFFKVSVITFCKILFIKKTKWKIILVLLQNFPSSWEIFPSPLFITTCKKKLSCDCKLFVLRTFLYDFQKLSSR